MFWLVVETFVLMTAFVAVGVLCGIGLRQMLGHGPELAVAGHASPAQAAEAPSAPVVVPVTHTDVAEAVVPVIDPIPADEAPDEAPAVKPAPAAVSVVPETPGTTPVTLSASEAVIDPGRAASADQVGVRPGALAGPRDGAPDDLKLIKGIGPQNESRLNALGVFHFDQIAAWTPEEARWIGSYLAFPGRIEREDWIGQARRFAV